jgi:glycosyltransferase involved in cell wall biosynthesis
MHIVFLTSEYPKLGFPHGGVGTFIQSLARWLVSCGHSVSVVGVNYSSMNEEQNDRGVKIFRLPKRNVKGLIWLLHSLDIGNKLKQIHRKEDIDIIEGTELSFAFIGKIKNVKYVIRLNGGHHFFAISENRSINWWKGYQEKRSFKKTDYVIGVSKYVLDHTSEYIDFKLKEKGIIFNPADLDKFHEAEYNKIIKGRIFFAGTVCEKKGIRQLIQAMPKIKNEIPSAHLLIAGRDWSFPISGKSYTEYVKQFIPADLENEVIFLGPIDNDKIPNYIEESEVCCYPSHMEAMPLAWIEVMAMGKSFVGSLSGPGPEIIQHGKNGLLCDALDPNDIAEKVIFMLKNPEAAKLMGDNARYFAIDNFSLDVIGKKNLDFYNSII